MGDAIAGKPFSQGAAEPARKGLIGVAEALSRVLALARPVTETELVPLAEATGRVLAEGARAAGPLPRFHSSAMHGYAVRRAELVGEGPWRPPVVGRVAAARRRRPRSRGRSAS